MKRIATLAVILLMAFTASAHSIRYFTQSQATRTVRYLNMQNEMMIYCGYEYESETYVLINEVWMERVNSAYYEIWVFGYDAYTGDEVYMPLDLGCVWLFSAGRMYNAAQYLRFHTTARMPSHITWYVPAYNPYTRVMHRPGYRHSYHYDIHRYGWMPPAYTYGPGMPPPPLPHYYMRHPNTPAPHPTGTWTPGTDRPQVAAPSTNGRTGTAGRVTTGSNTSHGTSTSSSRGTSTGTTTGGSSRGTSTGTTTTGSSRGTSTGTTTGSSRGTSTGTTTGSSRGTSTGTTTGSSRGTTTGTTTTGSSRGTTTGTTPTRSNATSSRGTTATSTETSSDKPAATSTRGTSTSTSSRGTSTGSSGRGSGTSNRGNNGSR